MKIISFLGGDAWPVLPGDPSAVRTSLGCGERRGPVRERIWAGRRRRRSRTRSFRSLFGSDLVLGGLHEAVERDLSCLELDEKPWNFMRSSQSSERACFEVKFQDLEPMSHRWSVVRHSRELEKSEPMTRSSEAIEFRDAWRSSCRYDVHLEHRITYNIEI